MFGVKWGSSSCHSSLSCPCFSLQWGIGGGFADKSGAVLQCHGSCPWHVRYGELLSWGGCEETAEVLGSYFLLYPQSLCRAGVELYTSLCSEFHLYPGGLCGSLLFFWQHPWVTLGSFWFYPEVSTKNCSSIPSKPAAHGMTGLKPHQKNIVFFVLVQPGPLQVYCCLLWPSPHI